MMALLTVLVLLALLTPSPLAAQETTVPPINIRDAVERARAFPAIAASEAQGNAAAAGIRSARANYLPDVNVFGQVNRATRNNVFGLLLPQTTIPNISGPV